MDMDWNMDFDPGTAYGASLYDDASPDILGVPNAQADFWEMQEFSDNCEPTSESFIIRQFGYDNISTNEFAYISQANGWYAPGGGTSPEHMGDMMDLFGIDNHTVQNASLEDLAGEIASGHGVIVAVNSGQLWEQGPMQDLFNWAGKQFGFDNPEDSPADHALCVTGFDVSDPDHPMVIVNDPGHPEGQGAAYPLDRFMDAWENSNFHMTATDNPLPSFTELAIRDSIAQYLPENDPSAADPMLGKASGGFLDDLADSVHELAGPLNSIAADIAGVIGAATGGFSAGASMGEDLFAGLLSDNDYAQWI